MSRAASNRAKAWLSLLLSAAAIGILPATASPEPPPDPRIRVVDYRATMVVPLTAFVGYHVHLEFAPGEYFVNLGAADTSSLDVGAEGSHLLLKPKQASAATNLTILTNRRVYLVDYRALARPPRAEEAVYSIVFRYPVVEAETHVAPVERTPADAKLDALRPASNDDYWYCGSPSLRPASAVDDGLQLRLTFAAHAALPVVFAAEPDGDETLVNTHVENDTIVVHRLAARFVLRRGRDVGCIVNRRAALPGRRAASGTVDGEIGRQTHEVAR